SLALSAAMLRVGPAIGLVDRPGSEAHKTSTRTIPTVGGVGIFWAIAAPMLAIIAAVWLVPADAWTGRLAPLRAHVPRPPPTTWTARRILGGLAIMQLAGLLGDRRRLAAGPELVARLVVATVLAMWFDMRVLHLFDAWGIGAHAASIAVSVMWIVAITNAMNM